MSKLEVDAIEPQSGTTLTLGASGDTVTIPSGATLSSTDPLVFPAGTASLPAVTTTGDTNTGIFFPAADTIGFAEGGTEAMRIDSSGRVGIGTTNPSFELSILSGSGRIQLGESGATKYALLESSNGRLFLHSDQGNTEANSDMRFLIDNTERMRIDSSGHILVGTTSSPASPLAGNKYIKLGTPSIEGNGTADVSVSTTDVSLSNAKGAGFGFVGGYNTSTGAQFNAIVQFTLNASITVVSVINNTGLTLTFSAGSGILKLKTSSGTVAANYTVIGA